MSSPSSGSKNKREAGSKQSDVRCIVVSAAFIITVVTILLSCYWWRVHSIGPEARRKYRQGRVPLESP
jgi:hypothetical protein